MSGESDMVAPYERRRRSRKGPCGIRKTCQTAGMGIDAAAGIGLDGGVYGSRMTGGGFGGCTVSLVDRSKAQDVAQRIADEYAQKSGLTATQFLTRPARGAHVVE